MRLDAVVLALKMSALLVSNLDNSKEFRRNSMSNLTEAIPLCSNKFV